MKVYVVTKTDTYKDSKVVGVYTDHDTALNAERDAMDSSDVLYTSIDEVPLNESRGEEVRKEEPLSFEGGVTARYLANQEYLVKGSVIGKRFTVQGYSGPCVVTRTQKGTVGVRFPWAQSEFRIPPEVLMSEIHDVR